MIYHEKLEQVILYIEEHLFDDIRVEAISLHTHFSIPQLYRIFRSAVGVPIAEYIRMRRMSEAACELMKKSNRIIDVAMKYGYDSQEAFTRAFQKSFSISPGLYRKNQYGITLFERFSCKKNQNSSLIPDGLEINIVVRNVIRLTGMKIKTSVEDALENASIIKFEEREFIPRLSEINNVLDRSMLYGVESWDNTEEQIIHFSSVEVQNFTSIPIGMTTKEIEPSKYAVFQYTGSVCPEVDAKLKSYIFGHWILTNNYEWNKDYIIECFQFNSKCECDFFSIYLPIQNVST